MDIAGDLAALKDNLAKFKKGKMKGLEDIDINELDWVSFHNTGCPPKHCNLETI